jgi:hypothetical protein
MERKKQGWRRKESDNTLWSKVVVGAFLVDTAEAECLRHSDGEGALVGMVGRGRKITVGVDGRTP